MARLTEQEIAAQIDAAIANQAQIDAIEPRANKVLFENNEFTLHFNNGASFSFLPNSVEVIANLSPEILATVELTPSRKGLRWDKPDIDISIQGLILEMFGRSGQVKETITKS